jgi:hypothetical protein
MAGTPIAFASAHSAAVFIEQFPKHLAGVYPPEGLSAKVRKSILREMRRRGFQIRRSTIEISAKRTQTNRCHV